jgi:hypothetical protein
MPKEGLTSGFAFRVERRTITKVILNGRPPVPVNYVRPEMIAPAGFENYFAALAGAGDPGRRPDLAAKYGVTCSSDRVAGLASSYNLKLLGK